jgi:hypothetical protein
MDAMRCLVLAVLCGVPSFATVAAEGPSPAPAESAADVPPGIYRADAKGPDSGRLYLILDERRAVLQNENGQVLIACRMVREPDGLILFRVGKPTDMRVVARGDGVTVVGKEGQPAFADVFTHCPEPPEAIGLQPYELPETDADPDRRRAVAAELARRFDLEQRLRGEALAVMGGRMDEATLQKPEVMKKWHEVEVVDEDNRAWLSKTLRTSGWIGRKTHGDKAHQAVLLVMLHNVADLRLAATALAKMQAEADRGEIGEASVANLADRFALTMGEPLTYGIQAVSGEDGRPIIPIIADTARVDANRKRIGQPPLAKAAAMSQATIVRIDEDGRLVPGGDAAVAGLDAIDRRKAVTDPGWGLAEAGKADPALGAAVTAARAGDSAPLAAWCKQVPKPHRVLLANMLLGLARVAPKGEAAEAVVAERPLFEGYLAGVPAEDDARVLVGNVLANALVARATAPSAEDLTRAGALANDLETALERPEVERHPLGHTIADTLACVRYRQGQLPAAAALWQKAMTLAGAKAPEVYRRRLAAAEAGDAAAPLPR